MHSIPPDDLITGPAISWHAERVREQRERVVASRGDITTFGVDGIAPDLTHFLRVVRPRDPSHAGDG